MNPTGDGGPMNVAGKGKMPMREAGLTSASASSRCSTSAPTRPIWCDDGVSSMAAATSRSVQLRYQETVDVREFEPKIQKLLDDHVVALPAETIIEVVNINDLDAMKAVVEETGVSEASRADRIARASRRAITEKIEEDRTFYRQFSDLLEETIRAYRERLLSERDYLNSVVDLASKVARKDRGREVPAPIRGNEDAQAFYGVLDAQLTTKDGAQVSSDDDDTAEAVERHPKYASRTSSCSSSA